MLWYRTFPLSSPPAKRQRDSVSILMQSIIKSMINQQSIPVVAQLLSDIMTQPCRGCRGHWPLSDRAGWLRIQVSSCGMCDGKSGTWANFCSGILIFVSIPLAAQSKAWFCGCWPSGIGGSNPAVGMDVYLTFR